MNAFADRIDIVNRVVGNIVRWAALIMMVVQFSIVLLRYVFGFSSIAMNESVLYMHGTLFMLGAGYTLLVDAHVRVDIFYAKASPRRKAAIDIFGHIFLLIPSMLVLLFWSWPSVRNSWSIYEGPISVGGIPASFLLKSLIPAFCVLLVVQSLSCLLRDIARFPGTQPMIGHLDLLMFAGLIACILLGFPVSFSIAGVATAFAFLGYALGVMDITLLGALGQRVFGVLTNDVLIAIPLFVIMGVVLEKSRIAEELLETMGGLFGRLRGGLGVSVVLVGALLAASTGIVGATVIAMGMIALPTMLRNGYDPRLASGIVCTSGTLGQIIPPSTLLIILSDVMSNAYQQAQYEQGKFTVETISVGQIFAAALLPGLMLVVVYILYVLGRAWLYPADAPAARDLRDKPSTAEIVASIAPPVLLIIAVLGAILGGIATPTEAAAVGAIGAVLMAGRRQGVAAWLIVAGVVSLLLLAVAAGAAPVRLQRSDATIADWVQGFAYMALALTGVAAIAASLWRAWRTGMLQAALTSTMTVTSMIFATILTASMFSLVFIGLGGEETIGEILTAMPGGETGALIFCMALIFVLGFFLDFVEITVILLPLITPVLILMGHDPVWLAILIAINLQTSFLTPPFGFSLFYLRGAAPPEITTGQIYAGVAPFIVLQIIGVGIVWLWPALPTWLPGIVF